MAELLAALQRMLRRDHLPTPTLLVRLTDGRIRLTTTPRDIAEARDHLIQLRNEYGPAQAAFWISVEPGCDGIQFAVESLLPPQPMRLGGLIQTCQLATESKLARRSPRGSCDGPVHDMSLVSFA